MPVISHNLAASERLIAPSQRIPATRVTGRSCRHTFAVRPPGRVSQRTLRRSTPRTGEIAKRESVRGPASPSDPPAGSSARLDAPVLRGRAAGSGRLRVDFDDELSSFHLESCGSVKSQNVV
mgnify:CR=1 FL=1